MKDLCESFNMSCSKLKNFRKTSRTICVWQRQLRTRLKASLACSLLTTERASGAGRGHSWVLCPRNLTPDTSNGISCFHTSLRVCDEEGGGVRHQGEGGTSRYAELGQDGKGYTTAVLSLTSSGQLQFH